MEFFHNNKNGFHQCQKQQINKKLVVDFYSAKMTKENGSGA